MHMATHKVPQDVEADDKLIGPFSFRQIVYLLISAGAGFLAFELGKLALPLAIIPAPVCLFFLIIALPLRKDQPTEIYLAAVVKYFLKPHQRMWVADGEAPLVEISAPVTERPAIKDLNDEEVSRRLSFLTNITDTQGWSTRGYSVPVNNTNLNDDYASDAVNAPDIMEGGALNDAIGQKLAQSDAKVRNNAIKEMHAAAEPAPTADATPQLTVQQPVVQTQPASPVQPQTSATPISAPVVNSPFAPSQPVMPTASAGYYNPTPAASEDVPDLQSRVVVPQHKSVQPIINNPTITTEAIPRPVVASPEPAPQPAASVPQAQPTAPSPAESKAKAQQSTPEPAIMEDDEPVIDVKLH